MPGCPRGAAGVVAFVVRVPRVRWFLDGGAWAAACEAVKAVKSANIWSIGMAAVAGVPLDVPVGAPAIVDPEAAAAGGAVAADA